MSEKQTPRYENLPTPEHEVVKTYEVQKNTEKKVEKLDSIESIRRSIENSSNNSQEIGVNLDKQEQQEEIAPTFINKDLKNVSFKRIMNRTQRHLSSAERGFSKFIHAPKIDKISEFSSKTLARPSGIVGGALIALLGSTILLYMSKHYGFAYNNVAFLLLFVGGFLLALMLEGIIKIFRRKSHN